MSAVPTRIAGLAIPDSPLAREATEFVSDPVGFQNRLLVVIRWSISFATRGRGARLITNPADADAAGRPAAHPEPGREPVRVLVSGANAGDAFRSAP